MFHSILDTLHEGVVVMAADSTIVYANPAYSRILGVPVNKVIGKKCCDIEPAAKCLQSLATKQPIKDQYEIVQSVGVPIVFSTNCLFHNGELIGICSVFRDISEIVSLNKKVAELKHQLNQYGRSSLPDSFAPLIGRHPSFVQALKLAAQVAPSETTVLIQGESGVGKELLARAIHQASRRKHKPFVTVNCAALPETLFESELFGYAGGAFTGAKAGGKQGKFHLADGGTLFLDEVGEIPLSLQAKLLRVLQEGEVERLGSVKPEKVNTRIIAATNADLEAMVARGAFRQDLFYRLNVICIRLPALREHPEDISLIAQAILEEINQVNNRNLAFSQEVMDLFTAYHWPGNVRELQNVIRHASLVAAERTIGVANLPSYLLERLSKQVHDQDSRAAIERALKLYTEGAEQEAIVEALRLANNNRSQAMDLLKISRRTFYKKLKKYNLL
ncbi:MAG: sigma 54-interacting transcriptional regulator [Armatimonadetes bacterium]|nr:sigma 54-interacting transcriptional regulator [Armatimonadota bacterium]